LTAAERSTDAFQHSRQILSEVGNDSRDAAQLNHRSHRDAGVTPSGENRNHLEVGRTANWQKFREPLDDTKHKITPASFKKSGICRQSALFDEGNTTMD
jgi:hypothetical protein